MPCKTEKSHTEKLLERRELILGIVHKTIKKDRFATDGDIQKALLAEGFPLDLSNARRWRQIAGFDSWRQRLKETKGK